MTEGTTEERLEGGSGRDGQRESERESWQIISRKRFRWEPWLLKLLKDFANHEAMPC